MRVALATSLHLDHGSTSLDVRLGDPLKMQAFVPVGLLSLKAYADRLLGNAVSISVHELNTLINSRVISNDINFYDQIASLVTRNSVDLVGLMTDADSLHHTVAIAKQIKRRDPKTLICVGGPASSPLGTAFLDRFHDFDYLVKGEGEVTFAELLAALDADRLPTQVTGLVWRHGEDVRINSGRELIRDLDSIPMPAFEAYQETGTAPLYLDVGRGCPFKCGFCSTAPFWERRYRMKSIDRIVTEMQLLKSRWGRDHINFSHDIFTADRKWTKKFCEVLQDIDIGVHWTCSTRTDTVDSELLECMAVAGCVEIYYGIESGARTIQRQIQKDLDLECAREIVETTAAVGIRPVTGFIVGYPFETEKSLSDTLTLFFDFLSVGGHRAHLFTLCPFQEAPMYAEYGKTISQRAEYHELALVNEVAVVGAKLLVEHPDVFASVYRYATPEIDQALVAATEELSAHLVVLRRIWPLLLPQYPSALDWYRRWVHWISIDNKARRSNTRLVHQGDLRDLLRFISSEIERLGLCNTLLASLVRYEKIKHVAAGTLPSGREFHDGAVLTSRTPVIRACRYLVAPFRHDLRAVLGSKNPAIDASEAPAINWVVFAKTGDGELHTLQVSALACRVLELSAAPIPLEELIHETLLRRSSCDDSEHLECRRIVEELIGCKLMSEASIQ